jgi:hypothetical protein
MGLLTWPVGSWLNIFTSQSHSLRKRLCYFKVQAVAPHFQGVPKHLDCSTSVLKQELAIWLGICMFSLVFWLGSAPLRRRGLPPLG